MLWKQLIVSIFFSGRGRRLCICTFGFWSCTRKAFSHIKCSRIWRQTRGPKPTPFFPRCRNNCHETSEHCQTQRGVFRSERRPAVFCCQTTRGWFEHGLWNCYRRYSSRNWWLGNEYQKQALKLRRTKGSVCYLWCVIKSEEGFRRRRTKRDCVENGWFDMKYIRTKERKK